MRVTDASTATYLTNELLANRSRLTAQQQRVSSGSRYLRRSENVADTAVAARLDAERQRAETWIVNVEAVAQWESVSGSTMERVMDDLQRLRELTVEARNGTATTADRQTLAAEVDSLLEDLVSMANQQQGDRYLFAGNRLDQAPMAVTRTDGRIDAVTYGGAATPRQAQLGEDLALAFGATAGGAGGLFADTEQGVDLFASAIGLRDELLAGELPAEERFAELDAAIGNVAGHLVTTGLRQQRLEQVLRRHDQEALAARERHSGLTETDMAAAVIELSRLQVTFQASLQMAANLNKLSMVNYV